MWYFMSDKFRSDVNGAMASQGISYRMLSRRTNIPLSTLFRKLKYPDNIGVYDLMFICNVLELYPTDYFDEKEIQMRLFR